MRTDAISDLSKEDNLRQFLNHSVDLESNEIEIQFDDYLEFVEIDDTSLDKRTDNNIMDTVLLTEEGKNKTVPVEDQYLTVQWPVKSAETPNEVPFRKANDTLTENSLKGIIGNQSITPFLPFGDPSLSVLGSLSCDHDETPLVRFNPVMDSEQRQHEKFLSSKTAHIENAVIDLATESKSNLSTSQCLGLALLKPSVLIRKGRRRFAVRITFADNCFLKVVKLSKQAPIYKFKAFCRLRHLDRMKHNPKYTFKDYETDENRFKSQWTRFVPRTTLEDISRRLGFPSFSQQLIDDILTLVLDIFVTQHVPNFPDKSLLQVMPEYQLRNCICALHPFIHIYFPSMDCELLYVIIRKAYDTKRLAWQRRLKRFLLLNFEAW